jgi:hypothetical protein
MSVKDVLDGLSAEQKSQLMVAFNAELPQFIKLEEGKFIGVNVTPDKYPNLKIEQSTGVWSIGTINGDTDAS